MSTSLRITSDFPAGNIVVEQVDATSATVRQDRRDTEGHWFWWYFAATSAGTLEVAFKFTDGPAVGVRGAAYQVPGDEWRWTGAESLRDDGFAYTFAHAGQTVRFAFAMPYTAANWRSFITRHESSDHLVREPLCRSRAGQEVAAWRLGCVHHDPRHRVLITARHHACESMASYSLEGFVDSIFAQDEDGAWLRDHVQCFVVPFVDQDGVEAGDQGKNRKPHDHNRDYDGISLYPETAALRRAIPTWCAAGLDAALDLHCPWIRGDWNEKLYLVGLPDPAIAAEQSRLVHLLHQGRVGPLPISANAILPWGTGWNSASSFTRGLAFAPWAAQLPRTRLAASIEVPYANAEGVEVNPSTARQFGQDLARALVQWLR